MLSVELPTEMNMSPEPINMPFIKCNLNVNKGLNVDDGVDWVEIIDKEIDLLR